MRAGVFVHPQAFEIEAVLGVVEDVFIEELLLAELGREVVHERVGDIDHLRGRLRHERARSDDRGGGNRGPCGSGPPKHISPSERFAFDVFHDDWVTHIILLCWFFDHHAARWLVTLGATSKA